MRPLPFDPMGRELSTRRLIAVLLALALFYALAPAGAGTSAAGTFEPPAGHPVPEKQRYLDRVFEQVKVKRDIVYGAAPGKSGETEELKLDLYLPKGDEIDRRPALIFAHGGGFAGGDKSEGPSPLLAERFARRGYVTASINYRLLAPEGGCTGSEGVTPECYNAAVEAVHDAQAAVRYLRANGNRWGIARQRIGIGGESAGAIIACGVAAYDEDTGSSGNPGYSSAVQGFMSLSGGLPGGVFVDERTAPGLLFASTGDPIVPYEWSVEMRDKMRSFDIPAKLVTFVSDVHVPFEEYRTMIEAKTKKRFYRYLDVKHAKGA